MAVESFFRFVSDGILSPYLNLILGSCIKDEQLQMPTYVPPQSAFFYKRPWTCELDTHLLLTFTNLKETYPWEGTSIPQVAINEASKILAGEHGIQLTCDELSTRVQVLKARYDTFNEVVATNGATWDLKHNVIVATEEVWSEILKRDPFAGAYYHRDEPNYNMLAICFGLQDVKEEDDMKIINVSDTPHAFGQAQHGTEVIVVSDTTEVIHPEDVTELVIISDSPQFFRNVKGVNLVFSPDMDEVNSPVLPMAKGVRRKLFTTDDVVTVDRNSSSAGPVPNPPHCSGPSAAARPWTSPPGSSCASCSPFPPTKY